MKKLIFIFMVLCFTVTSCDLLSMTNKPNNKPDNNNGTTGNYTGPLTIIFDENNGNNKTHERQIEYNSYAWNLTKEQSPTLDYDTNERAFKGWSLTKFTENLSDDAYSENLFWNPSRSSSKTIFRNNVTGPTLTLYAMWYVFPKTPNNEDENNDENINKVKLSLKIKHYNNADGYIIPEIDYTTLNYRLVERESASATDGETIADNLLCDASDNISKANGDILMEPGKRYFTLYASKNGKNLFIGENSVTITAGEPAELTFNLYPANEGTGGFSITLKLPENTYAESARACLCNEYYSTLDDYKFEEIDVSTGSDGRKYTTFTKNDVPSGLYGIRVKIYRKDGSEISTECKRLVLILNGCISEKTVNFNYTDASEGDITIIPPTYEDLEVTETVTGGSILPNGVIVLSKKANGGLNLSYTCSSANLFVDGAPYSSTVYDPFTIAVSNLTLGMHEAVLVVQKQSGEDYYSKVYTISVIE